MGVASVVHLADQQFVAALPVRPGSEDVHMGDDNIFHKMGKAFEHAMDDADDAVTSPEAARVAWTAGIEDGGTDSSPAATEPSGD